MSRFSGTLKVQIAVGANLGIQELADATGFLVHGSAVHARLHGHGRVGASPVEAGTPRWCHTGFRARTYPLVEGLTCRRLVLCGPLGDVE